MGTQTQIRVKEIAFTGYPVSDIQRAREFYEGIFGLVPSMVHEEEGNGWVEYEIQDAAFALYKYGEAGQPSPKGPAIALEVEDIHSTLAELERRQVTITFPLFESPVCWMASILDSEGNSLTLHQRKSN